MPMERQFSRIDWGGIGESFRQNIRKTQQQNLDGGGAESFGGKNFHAPAKSERKLRGKGRSVKFDLNSDADIYEEDTSSNSRRSPRCLLCALLLTVALVGAVVCFITIPPDTAIIYWKAMIGNSNTEQAVINVVAQQQQGQQQELLERAEQITSVCGKLSLLRRRISSESDSTGTGGTGMSSCQELCENHMCCVVEDEEYSCKNDENKDCGVYAGCEVLIKDNLW